MSKETVINDHREAIRGTDSLADTPFSELFHEARTASPRIYSGVTAQVRVRDGDLEVSSPVKTRQGEHLRGTDSWDGLLSLPVKPFMEVRTAQQEIRRQLKRLQRNVCVQ
jgi:hypothetical protein